MIIIASDAHVTADSNGYELFVDTIVMSKEVGADKSVEAKPVTKRIGGSYHSTMTSVFNAYIERHLKDMAKSDEVYQLVDVVNTIQELKNNINNHFTVNK